MPHSLFSLAGTAYLVACCMWTLVVGGWRERVAAVVFLAAAVLTFAVQDLAGREDPVLPFLILDALVLGALARLSWRAPVVWPFLATGLQGVAVALHLIRLVRRSLPAWTYVTALSVTSDLALAALAVGSANALRRRMRARR